MSEQPKRPTNDKIENLEPSKAQAEGERLTTNQGLPVADDQNTLSAGDRGPQLLEDFIFREKMTHFDHERIPERVVHARGSGAHGYFQVYESQASLTKAKFLQDPSKKTPVFVRFSTVVGSRGSADTVRDVRGFAVKFYTEEGNYDLVGNNIPVFFIQDGIKFPDLVHAIKPEPDREIPQAAAAHDTFWDFASLMPESTHMLMWLMSDRALPRSFRMMEGFGVHTFRLVNEQGQSRFVKFHWKPLLGAHSMVFDEAHKTAGADPDFLRRDLWDAIEQGDYPEWELGLQIVEERDEQRFDFDLLDATKIIPEEVVPVKRIGKMTLNRNPDNFFAETEQVAFHPGHIVSGIDFTDDPLLQGRLFSYLDTQLIRLGGPNFHEIPINRPVAPVHNHQRDGYHRQTIDKGRVSYEPNSLGGGCPMQAKSNMGGFMTYAAKLVGSKVRARGEKFFDHYSQATLFWKSQSEWEQAHIVDAFHFELGKVETVAIRERMVGQLAQVDQTLAARVAQELGLHVPKQPDKPLNRSVPADADVEKWQPKKSAPSTQQSPALSLANQPKGVKTRKVAILAADGFDDPALTGMQEALKASGAMGMIVAPRLGTLKGAGGSEVKIDFSFVTSSSVIFDAVYVPGGEKSVQVLMKKGKALHFIREAFLHCKTIAAVGAGVDLLREAQLDSYAQAEEERITSREGVVVTRRGDPAQLVEQFLAAIAEHRHWSRAKAEMPKAKSA
jgi:catalase